LRVRISDHEHRVLLERASKAEASTPSAYVRAAALTGREFEIPSNEMRRQIRNELIRLTGAIQNSPPGKVRDRALEAAINTLDRISQL
jgi:hypothetical protein